VRLVRGRADARWFPSRHNAALFRLFAYFRLRRAQPEHRDVILIIDRHQSAAETWIVMSWVTLTFACYLAATLFVDWPVALALLVSMPLSIAAIEIPAIASALTIAPLAGRADSIRVNSCVVMLLLVAASVYFSIRPTWTRLVAWQFLAMLGLNAIASVIVFALRDSIAELEANVGGGTPSAP
jgi:hypothetical protein